MNIYESRDLYTAVACLVAGCKLKEIKSSSHGYFTFVFFNSPDICEKAIQDFHSGKLTAPVKEVINSLSYLKYLMNQKRDYSYR